MNSLFMKRFPFSRIVCVCALLLAIPFAAGAHAFLDHAEPGVGRKIAASPATVKLWFTQNIEPAFSKIQVVDSSGNQVNKKDVHVDSKEKSLLVVSVPELPPGTYVVRWSVVSVDTHKTQGHFEFTIKPPN